MTKHVLNFAAALLVCGLPLKAQDEKPTRNSWSGLILNGDCTLDEAFAESANCTEDRGSSAKLVFYSDTIRKLFELEPADRAVGHLGDSVTVEGELRG